MINTWAVIVATLASMVIGGVWYSPLLFAKIWMKEIGLTAKDEPSMKKEAGKAMLGQLIASLVMAYVLAHVLGYSNAHTITLGIEGALWMWLGFQATGALSHVLFEQKSWTWFAINAGNSFVTAIVMGAIIGGWSM